MILNYIILLFLWENVLNKFAPHIFFNVILMSTILLKKNTNIMEMINPKLDKYINNYNNTIITKVKKLLINYILKEHIEILAKS